MYCVRSSDDLSELVQGGCEGHDRHKSDNGVGGDERVPGQPALDEVPCHIRGIAYWVVVRNSLRPLGHDGGRKKSTADEENREC